MKVSLRLCLASVGNYDYLVSFYSHSSICCLRGKNALLWGVLKQQMVSIHYRTLTSSCNQLDHTVGKLHEKVSYYNIASEASNVYFHHCRYPYFYPCLLGQLITYLAHFARNVVKWDIFWWFTKTVSKLEGQTSIFSYGRFSSLK